MARAPIYTRSLSFFEAACVRAVFAAAAAPSFPSGRYGPPSEPLLASAARGDVGLAVSRRRVRACERFARSRHGPKRFRLSGPVLARTAVRLI